MLTMELIVRRGTDGAVITRVVGNACTRVTWTAPGHAPIIEGSGGACLLEGFTYAPSLRKTREAAPLAARLVEPPQVQEDDQARGGGQSGLTASLPQPPTGD